jgi:hypothetical protein
MDTTASFNLLEKIQMALTITGFLAFVATLNYLYWFA